MRTNEGVVLGVEKKLPSKLMEPSKSEKLVEVSSNEFNGSINQIYCKLIDNWVSLLNRCFMNIDRQTLWMRYEWYRW